MIQTGQCLYGVRKNEFVDFCVMSFEGFRWVFSELPDADIFSVDGVMLKISEFVICKVFLGTANLCDTKGFDLL